MQVNPADVLTIQGGTTVSLKIRLGSGPAYLWGDSQSNCTSPIGTATTINTSGIYTPALSTVPFNPSSNDYVCVYSPSTSSLNTSVAWPHNGQLLAFNSQPINAAAGATISPAVTVQVKDSNGILVASSTASVALAITSGTPTSGGPGTLSGTLTKSAVNGVATFSNLSINTDGTAYSLAATSSGLTLGISGAFNISSGAATKLVYTTAPSTGTAGTAFSVTVQSQDANGNPSSPTSNTTITLSKATGGGTLSGTLTGTIPTSGNSVTISTPVYSAADTMTLKATATAGETSLASVTSGNIVFSAGAATKLVYTTVPSTGTAGTAFGVTVQSQDANGNPSSPTSSTTITLSKATGGGTLSGTLTGTILSSGNSVTISTPVYSKSDTMTLTATATAGETSLTAVTSGSIVFSAGAATELVYTTVPSTGTAGTAFSVTVQSQDANGNPSSPTSNTTITLSKATGGGTLSGTLTGTILTSGNSVTISTPVYSAADTMTLKATATAGETSLASVTSGNIVFSAGAATKLVYTTVPSTGTAGTAFGVTVQSQDANGNPSSPTSSTTITLSKATGGGTLSGTLTGTILSSGNSVTISTPVYSKSDTMTLTATATAGETSLTAVTSGSIVFSAGAATELVYTTVPSTGTAGTAFSVTVQSQDANGNPSSPTSNTTITLSKATGGGTLSGTLTGTILTSGNSVTISTPVYSAADTMTLKATATAGETSLASVTSGNIVFSAGAATKLVYTTVPSTGTAGTAFGVTVQSQDANGNPSSPTSSTTITLSKATGGGTLSGTLTGTILTSGNSVTISTPVYSKSDTMTLTATATAGETSLTAVTSGNIVFSAGAATQAVFTTQPGGGTGGTAWATQPVVTLEDANGNTVTGTAQNVTLAIQNNAGPGGALSGTTTVAVNTSTGLAAFSGLSINKTGTGYTLTATGSTVDTTPGVVVSNAFNIAIGAATQLAFSTSPSNGTSGLAFGTQPVATLQDAGGNTVTGTAQNVTLAIQNNAGPGGVLSGTKTVAVNTGTGQATFSGLSINIAGTGYTLTATGSTVDTTTGVVVSGAFNITAGAASRLAFSTSAFSGTAGVCSSQITVQTQDSNGNASNPSSLVTVALSSNSTGTKTFYSNSGCTISLTSLTITTAANSASFWYEDTQSGGPVITAAATGGVTSSLTQTETVNAAAANKLVWGQQPSATVTRSSSPISPTLTVFVEDQFGNLANGGNVVLTYQPNFSPNGSDVLSGTLIVSGSTGTATFSNAVFNGNKTNNTSVSTFTATLAGIANPTVVSNTFEVN